MLWCEDSAEVNSSWSQSHFISHISANFVKVTVSRLKFAVIFLCSSVKVIVRFYDVADYAVETL